MIDVADLRVELGGAQILRGLTFSVARGEWVGLLGPNGAGKTTALRALCGLVPYAGTIAVDGREAREAGRRRLARSIALVPQLPERPPELTVAEYVLLGRTPHLGYFANEGADDRAAAARALARLELEAFGDRALGSLSGGELQRAVLARALAQEASILLLDEPTSALDLGRQQQALELVVSLREDGLTIVSAMHDLTLAGEYADRLILLDRGSIVAEGTAHDVLSPKNIAEYYGASVRILEDAGHVFVLPFRGLEASPAKPAKPGRKSATAFGSRRG